MLIQFETSCKNLGNPPTLRSGVNLLTYTRLAVRVKVLRQSVHPRGETSAMISGETLGRLSVMMDPHRRPLVGVSRVQRRRSLTILPDRFVTVLERNDQKALRELLMDD